MLFTASRATSDFSEKKAKVSVQRGHIRIPFSSKSCSPDFHLNILSIETQRGTSRPLSYWITTVNFHPVWGFPAKHFTNAFTFRAPTPVLLRLSHCFVCFILCELRSLLLFAQVWIPMLIHFVGFCGRLSWADVFLYPVRLFLWMFVHIFYVSFAIQCHFHLPVSSAVPRTCHLEICPSVPKHVCCVCFSVLLVLTSQRIESLISFGGDSEGRVNREVRGAPPTIIEWMILAWVAGKLTYTLDNATSMTNGNKLTWSQQNVHKLRLKKDIPNVKR